MQNIIGSIASSFGIPPEIASSPVSGLTSMFLQKSTPKAAEGLLKALPTDITNQVTDDDKKKFRTGQENINRYDVLRQLSSVTGLNDTDKLEDLADTLLDSIKKNTNIDLSYGLDKDELFQALSDLSRQSGSSRQIDISGQPQHKV
jgi:hypothetical protein